MVAIELFAELRSIGVRLSIDPDGRVAYDAPVGVMTDDILGRMRSHRDGLLALCEQIEKRAAIMEFDGGMTRVDAERMVMAEVVGESSDCRSLVPVPALMPDGVHCPHCHRKTYHDVPVGWLCADCGRMAWLLLPNGSFVRADYENVDL